jgi:ribonuclease HII
MKDEDELYLVANFVKKKEPCMLLSYFQQDLVEAGLDEAGRGCLAGPVIAAAVIWNPLIKNELIKDSKLLTSRQRENTASFIKEFSLSWAIGIADENEIDKYNILQASILAMHRAVEALSIQPGFVLVDGNRFRPIPGIIHSCQVKGDNKYLSIAAASILAKTHRDGLMATLSNDYPLYDWQQNKGYPTLKHRKAIAEHGPTPHHRRSFSW